MGTTLLRKWQQDCGHTHEIGGRPKDMEIVDSTNRFPKVKEIVDPPARILDGCNLESNLISGSVINANLQIITKVCETDDARREKLQGRAPMPLDRCLTELCVLHQPQHDFSEGESRRGPQLRRSDFDKNCANLSGQKVVTEDATNVEDFDAKDNHFWTLGKNVCHLETVKIQEIHKNDFADPSGSSGGSPPTADEPGGRGRLRPEHARRQPREAKPKWLTKALEGCGGCNDKGCNGDESHQQTDQRDMKGFFDGLTFLGDNDGTTGMSSKLSLTPEHATVMPPGMAKHIRIHDSPGSKQGKEYKAANGSTIDIMGERCCTLQHLGPDVTIRRRLH